MEHEVTDTATPFCDAGIIPKEWAETERRINERRARVAEGVRILSEWETERRNAERRGEKS